MTSVTVVLTRYSEPDNLIFPCIIGLSRQTVPITVLFFDQHPSSSMKYLCSELSSKRCSFNYLPTPVLTLSKIRNMGLSRSTSDCVLFIDSDAIPSPEWAENLSNSLKQGAVVGGRAFPLWFASPPWFTKSKVVQATYSLIDLGPKTFRTNKIVGVSFGVRKSKIASLQFDERLGRRPGSLLGGEETEFCRRVIDLGESVFYVGSSTVQHQIQQDRVSIWWLLRRFYYGGLGKSIMGSLPSSSSSHSIYDLIILFIVTPAYLLGYVRGKFRE